MEPTDDLDERPDAASAAAGSPWRMVGWIAIGVVFVVLVGVLGYVIGNRRTTDQFALSDTDVGFLQDMIDHHNQAVEISLAAQRGITDPTVRDFANEVLLFQRREIGIMETLLANDGQVPGDVDRMVMGWMNMPTQLQYMPGMASPDQINALAAASGDDANRGFLTLMREHHRGGLHMAEYAAETASNPKVRELARRIADYQRIEVNEYTQLMQRLGYE